MKLSNTFKIKFLERIPVFKKSKLGTIKFTSFDYKPVNDDLTFKLIKSYKNPSLLGIIPFRNKFPDHVKMKKVFDKIIKALNVNKKGLIVYGYNLIEYEKIILYKLNANENLRSDFYDDLLIKMIRFNCTHSRFENKNMY
ncbi:MAG: hypothetical protein CL846_07765 [Crocinitomicaceae bacterium]|nr:hypothetical protein [Crocinitomicaceae bacterium]|tara:strand:- start:5537 stop:5956 length:420 start_codon:yes stop_codon:yes gene_type:complete